MRKRIFSILASSALLVSLLPMGANANSIEENELELVKNRSLLTDDFLIQKAREGEAINDTFTTSTVFQNNEVSIVSVDKKLSETYEGGELLKTSAVKTMDMVVDISEIDSQDELDQVIEEALSTTVTPVSPAAQTFSTSTVRGNKARESNSPSITVRLRYNAYYDILDVNGVSYYRIVYINHLATLLDSNFSLTRLETATGYLGYGGTLNSSGTFKASYGNDKLTYNINNPISGRVYTHTTGITRFTQDPAVGKGNTINAQAKIKYKRNATGVVYTFEMPNIENL